MSIERLASGLQILETTPNADGLWLQSPLTWSIWARVETNPDATLRAVFSFSTASVGLTGYNLMCLNSKLHFYLRVGIPNQWKIISAGTNVEVGKWYHCAGRVYTTGTTPDFVYYMEFWIDGVSQGTLTWDGMIVKYAADDLHIGYYMGSTINCYAGDFAIWAANLSDAEIFQLAGSRRANLPLMIQPGSLKGYWRFDELGDGKSVYDAIVDLGFYGFHNYSAGTGGDFAPAGTGDAYGRQVPCPHDFGMQVISFEAGMAPPSFRGLALLGVGT